jgi:hypothetical protein
VILAVAVGAPPASGAPVPEPPTVGSAHFQLTTDCDAETRTRVLGRLEAFRDALEILVLAATGVELGPSPVRMRLFEEPRDYAAYAWQNAPGLGHNGGFYDGATRTVYTYRRSNPTQLLFHEVTHAVMGDVFEDPWYERYARPGWPVWFDEGFAEYASSSALDPGGGDQVWRAATGAARHPGRRAGAWAADAAVAAIARPGGGFLRSVHGPLVRPGLGAG